MRAAPPLPSQKTDQTSTVPVEFCTKLHNSPVVSDLAPLVVLIPVLHKRYMQLWQIGNQGFFFKKNEQTDRPVSGRLAAAPTSLFAL
jgi:hypothetical protein